MRKIRTWQEVTEQLARIEPPEGLTVQEATVELSEAIGSFTKLTKEGREGAVWEIEHAAADVLACLVIMEKLNGYEEFARWWLSNSDQLMNAPRSLLLHRLHQINRPNNINTSVVIVLTIMAQCGASYRRSLELAIFGEEEEDKQWPDIFYKMAEKVKEVFKK